MTSMAQTSQKLYSTPPLPNKSSIPEISARLVSLVLAAAVSTSAITYRPQSNTSTIVRELPTVGLEYFYHLRNPEEIHAFLARHADLMPMLPLIQGTLQKFFPYTQFDLEFCIDPEEAELSALFVYVVTDMDPESALDALDKFDNEWWVDRLGEVGGRIVVNLSFL